MQEKKSVKCKQQHPTAEEIDYICYVITIVFSTIAILISLSK